MAADIKSEWVAALRRNLHCVVVSQNPESGKSDFDTLRAILSYRGAMSEDLSTPTAHLPDGAKIVFGVYGQVKEPGRVAVGDGASVVGG
jgi:uncharacterized protein